MTKIASSRMNRAPAGGGGKLSRLGMVLALAVLVVGGLWWFVKKPTETTNHSAKGAEQAKKPQYGGQVNIGNVALALSALSWDSADFNWKHNLDTGLVYEQLFAADL